jgi:signal transduction histidine kinase
VASRKVRFPLRLQISILLFLFSVAVSLSFYFVSFSYFESDKLRSTKDLQTSQAENNARSVTDKIKRYRLQLREAALGLLDPGRAKASPPENVWDFIKVRDKSWKNSSLAGTEYDSMQTDIESLAQTEKDFFVAANQNKVQSVFLKDTLNAREKGQDIKIPLVGSMLRSLLFGESDFLNRGPGRGYLIDLDNSDIQKSVWLAEPRDIDLLGAIYKKLPKNLFENLASSKQTQTFEYEIGDGQDVIYVSVAKPQVDLANNLNIAAIVVSKKSDILNSFADVKRNLFLLSIMLVGLGLMAAHVVGSGLSKPLENLVKATQVLETGDFSVRVKDSRPDEVGELAASFNHMGGALQEREEALASAQMALVQNEKLAALGTLSAGIAHEIKNPLAGILGHADMTVNRIKSMSIQQPESLLKHLETIQKEVKRCRSIIDNLMRFSRQDKGGKTDYELVDLETVSWDAIHLMEHPLNLAKVRVEKEFTADAMCVYGNSNQIEQVLLNMLQNAGHAMPEGGVVKIGTQHYSETDDPQLGRLLAYQHESFSGPFMRVYVVDSGVGMTDEVQKKIFEPFFTTKPKGVGTGLGLSVTMAIIAEHQARVSISSAPGQGTAFFIDFMDKAPRNDAIFARLSEVSAHKSGQQEQVVNRITEEPQAPEVIVSPAVVAESPSVVLEPRPTGFSESQTSHTQTGFSLRRPSKNTNSGDINS